MKSKLNTSGYSLIELSIVLVIIGLISGGILTGRSLIHTSQLNSILKKKEEYLSAINAFNQKYGSYPGDFPTATTVWGEVDTTENCLRPTSANDGNDVGQGNNTQTCNGNGDGQIASFDEGGWDSFERHRLWQHLTNASLVEGQYTGVKGVNGEAHVIVGENAPKTRIPGGGYSLFYFGSVEGNSRFFNGVYNHVLMVGKERWNAGPYDSFLSPEDTWGLDKKADDGKPARGRLVVREDTSHCHDAADEADLDADYDLTQEGQRCALIFRNLF